MLDDRKQLAKAIRALSAEEYQAFVRKLAEHTWRLWQAKARREKERNQHHKRK